MNALCGAIAAAAFDDLLVVDLELLLPELVVDLELLLSELLAPFALLLIVGEVEGLGVGANASIVGELEGANTSLVGAGVSVSVGLGVAKGSGVGAKGSKDGDGEEISEQQKAKAPMLIVNKHNSLFEGTSSAPS